MWLPQFVVLVCAWAAVSLTVEPEEEETVMVRIMAKSDGTNLYDELTSLGKHMQQCGMIQGFNCFS